MAPPRRTLRKTACETCVAAKRRCDSALPSCDRCGRLGMPCTYPFPRSTHPPISNTQPEPVTPPPGRAIAPVRRASDTGSTRPDSPATTPIVADATIAPPAAAAAPLAPAAVAWSIAESSSVGAQAGIVPSFMQNGAFRAEMDWPGALMTWDTSFGFPCTDPATTSGPPPFCFSDMGNIDFTGVTSDWQPLVDNTPASDALIPASRDENWSQYIRHVEKRQSPAVTYLAVRPPKVPRSVMSNQPYWPRGADRATWRFCADELLSFVQGFARTGSTHFIQPFPGVENPDGNLVLNRALGVCAARETLGEEGRDTFEALLDAEVAQLVDSSMSGPTSTLVGPGVDGGMAELVALFRMELSRLQAMVLYQTIRLFGPSYYQQKIGEGLEPLLAAWTRELLIKIHLLEAHSQQKHSSPQMSSDQVAFDGPSNENASTTLPSNDSDHQQTARNEDCLTHAEIQSAYRTILVSYLIRGVFAALIHQICHLVGEMATLPVLVSEPASLDQDARAAHRQCLGVTPGQQQEGGTPTLPGCHRMSYGDLAAAWNTHRMAPITNYDQFTQLLMVACKGVEIIHSGS